MEEKVKGVFLNVEDDIWILGTMVVEDEIWYVYFKAKILLDISFTN